MDHVMSMTIGINLEIYNNCYTNNQNETQYIINPRTSI